MDYRLLQPQPGMARLNGSNRAAWNAMDLEISAHVPPSTARSSVEDCGALSARNVLLRQKLRERKRYDSADDAMKKAAARATSQEMIGSSRMQQEQEEPIRSRERPFSPAQMGQSAFFNAMDSGMAKRIVQSNAFTSSLYEAQAGGVVQGRNIGSHCNNLPLDLTDVSMIKTRRGQEVTDQMEDTFIEDISEGELAPMEVMSSPCASFAATASRRQQVASMSPSRAGKYGALETKMKLDRQTVLDHQQQKNAKTALDADDKTQQARASDYGKLSAAHVLIRRKLKERKRFDSADYAMEKQGQQTDVPANVAANPVAPSTAVSRYHTLGTSQAAINHQVKHIKLSESLNGRVASVAVANAAQAALAARAARYAGLKNGNTMVDKNSSHAALDRYGLDKSGAAAARNLVLQRKLAERKMFDSADHFKEAA